ncbi:MAG: phosphate acyltransferase PlsX [candidate division Zixibacteria bacterium]|nr:phosphate acyltransferase PlsX [candidate division Zixibacteria bacterium]
MTENLQITIGLDVMGTDNGPDEIIAGGIEAARQFGSGCKIILVGKSDAIKSVLTGYRDVPVNLDIHHAPNVVAMIDSPADAIRRKDTSISELFKMHKEGIVDAVVSPGNTGAVMGTAVLNLGRLREVKRPCIASFFPAVNKGQSLVLDVGANSDCKPLNLYQFAIMGSIMAEYMMKKKRPRVGLLSIGEESSKGNELTIAAFPLLKNNPALNFIGNIEGHDILGGKVDVVVTDGFVGNVVLKFAESVEGFLTTSIRHQVSTNVFSRVGATLMYPFLRRLRGTFDYSEYGGAPLLGINGVTIICHGGSSGKAIVSGLALARDMVFHQINKKIETVLMAGSSGEKRSVNYNMNGISDVKK